MTDEGAWYWIKVTAAWVGGFLLFLLVIVGLWIGFKTVHRSQIRADANNKVKVTHIQIRNTQQQVQVVNAKTQIVKALAEQRYQQSVGIRRAQDEIASTLTPLYVQHEAIEAQRENGNEKIYIPVGNQGIPLVNNVNQDTVTVGK